MRTATRRVHRHGLREHLAAALFYGPFRCQLCDKRFLAWCLGRQGDAPLTDRREYERFSSGFLTSFSGEPGWGQGTVVDLSLKGCAVEGTTPLQPGGQLALAIHVSQYAPAIEIKQAFVRWATESKFGVEFRDVRREQAMRLREVIQDCWSMDRARASASSV
ncbi:MAG: hypothetical protein AUH96_08330 [Nitrospirae bacterium 13_2_20CM_2_61_4]|nr:MAG: hypothetical protein AUH96_08330 [Nitrospirae bacterium 13_2_20CM_2_61_4]